MFADGKRNIGVFTFADVRHITDLTLELQLDINGVLNLNAHFDISGKRYMAKVHGTTGTF